MPSNDPLHPGPPGADPHDAPAFWAVVPAGGSGTRLWPLSRASQPKYLLPLLGDHSLLETTVARLTTLAGPDRTIVVCGASHAPAVARQLPAVPDANVVVEPSPRGTGPAIGLAAALIARQDPDAVMGSFAADHDVRDLPAFGRAVRTAVAVAADGWLVTLGIAPTRPETGYGYIERTDDVVHAGPDGTAYRAARFVEKPELARATEFVATGRFSWNASMFVWSVRTFLTELTRLQPELAVGLETIAAAWGTPDAERVLGEVWPTLPEVTIDHGIMERASHVAVVPVEMGWSDVGDWHGLGELLPSDDLGNCGVGDRLVVDSRGSVVWSDTGRMVAIVGLDDIVVVDTEDAVLVTRRSTAQSVKDVVGHLQARHRDGLT